MNRFKEGSLNRSHGTKLISFQFNGREFEVRTSDHSLERFKERNVDIDAAVGSIVALGKQRLDYFASQGSDVAIIDKQNKISVIITFESEDNYTQIRIVTVIPRVNIFVKDGTKIYNLVNYKGGF